LNRALAVGAFLLLPSLAWSAPALAPSESARVIRADLGQVKGPLPRVFRRCVGAGRANEGLRADWQDQLRLVKRELGFEYLRLHGLFHDDMGVYFEDKQGRPVYNWQYVDLLHDFLLEIGVRPFVELSFMPQPLASGTASIFWWKGNITPPKSHEKWAGLVEAFVAHSIERYGREEVARWYFEVWNEPNLDVFFAGKQGDYFALYDHTARAIKKACPECRVGGPATAGNAWIPEMIAHCQKADVPLDFVSTHDYSIVRGFVDPNGDQATVLDTNPHAITGNVRRSRQQIAESALPRLELHYTEWSSSYTPTDPVHDVYQQAAFILDKIRNVGTAADSMSYWTFTDIFEEAGPRATPFHGGFGLLNYQALKKPAYFAYLFLNALGETELRNEDAASFVTRTADGDAQVLFWDFTITHPGDPVANQEYFRRDLPAKPKGKARIELQSLAPGRYALEATRVGYRENDVYSAYRDLGTPSQLTRREVEALRAKSDGRPFLREIVFVGADGRFSRVLDLRENDVCLLTLVRLRGGAGAE
jgi:xylan 1,4-beta-xylosidase